MLLTIAVVTVACIVIVRIRQRHPRLWPALRNAALVSVALQLWDVYQDFDAGRWLSGLVGLALTAVAGKFALDLHLEIQQRRQIAALNSIPTQ